MAQDRIVELECMIELVQGFLVTLDVHQHVVRLVHLLDRVGHLAASPVFETVNLAALGGDQGAVAFDHGGHLLALIGVNDENNFVMSHEYSLRVKASRHAGR